MSHSNQAHSNQAHSNQAHSNQDCLDRAWNYPYEFVRRSFLFKSNDFESRAPFSSDALNHRMPVLAFGSNQSPRRLAEKFSPSETHLIPVERAVLHDFDVGYSAHITSYGAVPAMLQYMPGRRVELAITWLDDRQLDIMHRSEIKAANYQFSALDDVVLERRGGKTMRTVYCYVGTCGQMQVNGAAAFLDAIKCAGRKKPAYNTREILEYIHRRQKIACNFEEFTLALIKDSCFRRDISKRISRDALRFEFPHRPIKSAIS